MIVLVGDYSSVHFELSSALKREGVKVLLISDGDAYKKINCDITAPNLRIYQKKWLKLLVYLFRFFGFFGVFNYLKVRKDLEKIKNIDVVQLINTVPISALGAVGNFLLIRYLKKRSRLMSLCALGDDYKWVSACLKKYYKYSALDRLSDEGIKSVFSYLYSLKYVYSPLYFMLDVYARQKANIIIPGLLDYELAYFGEPKCISKVDIPINPNGFKKPKKTEYPLKIFHAWQKGKSRRKGNDVLDRIVRRYISTHGDSKIKYEIISGISYEEYLNKYSEADIILDQIYSYDRGVTGALGMAAGKIVFSGFEVGGGEIGINATPDEHKLYKDFEKIVESLNLVDAIKQNAFSYATCKHDPKIVMMKYMKAWGCDCQKT